MLQEQGAALRQHLQRPSEREAGFCNPQTQKRLVLPPLNLRRNPVLIYLLVNHSPYSCKVIAAGSSSEGSSQCTEVFDSETWKWTRVGNIPGPELCLNEYQNGVCIDRKLHCIAFQEDDSGKGFSGKGVVAFSLDEGKWMSGLKFPLPFSTSSLVTSNMQLLECDGDLYLFSERTDALDIQRRVYHCIEKLESVELGTTVTRKWRNVVKCETSGSWGSSGLPEYTCVPHGDGKICIFNNIKHKGVVHDTVHGVKVDLLAPPASLDDDGRYYSSNPLLFTFLPRSFGEVSVRILIKIHKVQR